MQPVDYLHIITHDCLMKEQCCMSLRFTNRSHRILLLVGANIRLYRTFPSFRDSNP
jgi:hypothetical protein